VTLHEKGGRIKPDELQNVVPEICACKCCDDTVMIPELEKRAKIENSHTVDTWSDQSGSDEESPTMSISWTCNDISMYCSLYR
jgi:hypothetical protein